MSCPWICLSLLYAAALLQSSASPATVSLDCRETVEVVAGETVTLNCSIHLEDCAVERYQWESRHVKNICNSTLEKYKWDSDNLTYVSLEISDVLEDEIYTVSLLAHCAMPESSIRVQVKQRPNSSNSTPAAPVALQDKPKSTLAMWAGVVSTLTITGILLFYLGRYKGTQIMDCIKKKTGQTSYSETPQDHNV